MSKELDALEDLFDGYIETDDYVRAKYGYTPNKERANYELIKSALERLKKVETENAELKKLEKALEIVKKYSIEYCASMVNMENYQHYLESFLCSGGIIATEEEFNLLKKMREEKQI